MAETKPEDKTETEPDIKAETNSDLTTDSKEEPKPEAKEELPADLAPQTVQRVHKLYEALGREDVKEAQEWEKAQQEKQK